MTPLTVQRRPTVITTSLKGANVAAPTQTEPKMIKLLALLIAVTMSCGAGAAITISLAPWAAERVVAGY